MAGAGAQQGAGVSTAKRVGYVIAVAVNAAMLWFANQLPAWGWSSWLTGEFEDVLPAINRSLVASILANLAYVFYDRSWFKSLTQIVVLVISLQATIALLAVFPFDFSTYAINWDAVARVVLVVAVVGIVIAIISEAVKLGKAIKATSA